jgi:hypothetical protein
MVNSKKILCVSLTVVLLFALTSIVLASDSYNPWNRPGVKPNPDTGIMTEPPVMDYVPQEIGIYDTLYSEHTEHNCRKCHGNSTADRHHYMPIVRRDQLCTPCHPPCTPGTQDCPNGIKIIRNCTTAGCHSWDDVGPKDETANPPNGWHHNTDMAAAENCIACHDPNLIEEITPFRSHETYPPSVVSPTPFACENCHWEQALIPGDPCTTSGTGHPSTFEHTDYWGNWVGFLAYGKPIYNNDDLHHMGWKGNVSADCYKCHSQDPSNPSWDPENPELMRYCEICHSVRTLHSIQPHVSYHAGWVAVGFHVPPTNQDPTDLAPVDYRTNDNGSGLIAKDEDGDGLEGEDPIDGIDNDGDGRTDEDPHNFWGQVCTAVRQNPAFSADEQCIGCHGVGVPSWFPEIPPALPSIDTSFEGMQPIAGSCGAIVTLRGDNFGNDHIATRRVEIKKEGCATCSWIPVPIHVWSNTLIEWELPCWTFDEGNYKVRVVTEIGTSNFVIFTVKDHPTAACVDRNADTVCTAADDNASGPCGQTLTIRGDGFGNVQSQMFADHYHGVHHVVDAVASSGEYTATEYVAWSNTKIKVNFWQLFQDQVDTCGEPTNLRNFVRDTGTPVPPADTDGDQKEGGGVGLPGDNKCYDGIDNDSDTLIDGADPQCRTGPAVDEDPINGIDDDGDTLVDEDPVGCAGHVCPAEPIIKRCDCLALGEFQIYVKAVYFGDDDRDGKLSCGDTIFEVEKSDPIPFELTNEPSLYKVAPKKQEPMQVTWLYGVNFGVMSPGDVVRVGKESHYNTNCLTLGSTQKVKQWSNTQIKVKLNNIPTGWLGQWRVVWVVSNGQCSNALPLKILTPLP